MNRDTYKRYGLIAAVPALLLFVHFVSPQSVDGFFPFPHSVHAQTEGEGSVLHDPSIDLLQAALNSDPNPNKGEHEMEIAGGSALLPHGGPGYVEGAEVKEKVSGTFITPLSHRRKVPDTSKKGT